MANLTVADVQAKYAHLYSFARDCSPAGRGREKAYLDLKIELAEIGALATKAAQKRQLARMIACYENLMDDQDPVFNAKNETLRAAVNDLKQIRTFTVIR